MVLKKSNQKQSNHNIVQDRDDDGGGMIDDGSNGSTTTMESLKQLNIQQQQRNNSLMRDPSCVETLITVVSSLVTKVQTLEKTVCDLKQQLEMVSGQKNELIPHSSSHQQPVSSLNTIIRHTHEPITEKPTNKVPSPQKHVQQHQRAPQQQPQKEEEEEVETTLSSPPHEHQSIIDDINDAPVYEAYEHHQRDEETIGNTSTSINNDIDLNITDAESDTANSISEAPEQHGTQQSEEECLIIEDDSGDDDSFSEITDSRAEVDDDDIMMFDDNLARSSNIFSQTHDNAQTDALLRELESTYSVTVPQFVFDKLMSHQKHGVHFLWDNMFKYDDGINGCILADFMGLGKTLQVATLVTLYLSRHRVCSTALDRYTFTYHLIPIMIYLRDYIYTCIFDINQNHCVLILCPASVCQHWEREFAKLKAWAGEHEKDACKFLSPRILGSCKTMEGRLDMLEKWKKDGNVLISTYDLYRQCVFCGDARFYEYLAQPGPDMIVLDEGHKVKHMSSQISKALCSIATKRRIIMTGYPLQNNLMEYFTMINFAVPDLLGSPLNFRSKYEKPISRVQSGAKCTHLQKKQARRKAWMLHEKVKHIILRRDISLLKATLPKKHETIVNIALSPVQLKLYQRFLTAIEESPNRISTFWGFNVLTMLCNHPDVLYNYYIAKKKEFNSKLNQSADQSAKGSSSAKGTSKKPNASTDASQAFDSALEKELDMYIKVGMNEQQTAELLSFEAQKDIVDILGAVFSDREATGYKKAVLENGGKMVVLYSMIFQARKLEDKMVVFSRSLNTLNFIQATLTRYNKKKPKDQHINFLRFDGSTSLTDRQQYIDQFNDKDGDKHLLLVSTLAGGEGINLCGANRVVLMDVNWNPSHDCEACCRVFRFGQDKEVFIYRLITDDTIEDKVHQRQINKELLSSWVVDDGATDVLELTDAKKLFELPKATKDVPASTEEVEDDQLLTNIIQRYPQWITKVNLHEHLLSEDPSNILTEEDKQLAKGEDQFESVYGVARPAPKRDNLAQKQPNKTKKQTTASSVTQSNLQQENEVRSELDEAYQAELQTFLISELEQEERKAAKKSTNTKLSKQEKEKESSTHQKSSDLSHLYSLVDDDKLKDELAKAAATTQNITSQMSATDQAAIAAHKRLEMEKSTMAERMALKAKQRKIQKKRDGILPTPNTITLAPGSRQSSSSSYGGHHNNRYNSGSGYSGGGGGRFARSGGHSNSASSSSGSSDRYSRNTSSYQQHNTSSNYAPPHQESSSRGYNGNGQPPHKRSRSRDDDEQQNSSYNHHNQYSKRARY